MSNYKIGLQLFSVKPHMIEDMESTLHRVAEIGYDCVEFAGYFSHSAQEVRAICDDCGLEIASVHQKYDVFLEVPKESVDFLKVLGTKYAAIPHVAEATWLDSYEQTIREIRQAAQLLKDNGIQMIYHNHAVEMVHERDGRPLLDALLEDVGPELIRPELDLAWVHYGGYDPVAYLKKYPASECVHMRDFECTLLPTGQLYEMGEARKRSGVKFDSDAEGLQSRPVGSGRQNFPRIMDALAQTNAKYLIVELTKRPGATEFEDVKASLDYLRAATETK